VSGMNLVGSCGNIPDYDSELFLYDFSHLCINVVFYLPCLLNFFNDNGLFYCSSDINKPSYRGTLHSFPKEIVLWLF